MHAAARKTSFSTAHSRQAGAALFVFSVRFKAASCLAISLPPSAAWEESKNKTVMH